MKFKLCIPIRAENLNELLSKIDQASKEADIVELWLGDLPSSELDLEKIFAAKKKSYLLNVKGPKEHGKFRGMDQKKLEILLEGARRGAEYCDLDFQFPEKLIRKFIQEKRKTDLILSAHYFKHTPSLRSLISVTKKMQKLGANVVKIAALAKSHSDLLTILQLTTKLQKEKKRFITISMGEHGKISRIITPLMGGEMMFASLSAGEATAEGQLAVTELRDLAKLLS